MARWSNPADALVALANVVSTVAPDAVLVVGIDGVGRGRECDCKCGLLRVEMQSLDPIDGGPAVLQVNPKLSMRASVIWTTCIPVISANGNAPPALTSTNASLATLRAGTKILRSLRSANDDAAWWRFVGMLPAGEANCEGVRIDLECDISVCGFDAEEPRSICP